MGKSLTKKAEEKVYNLLFELENEFDIENDKLPEVYYVGKNFSNKNILFSEFFYDNIEQLKLKKNMEAFCSNNPPAIFTSNLNKVYLGEEVGHFLHMNHLRFNSKRLVDEFSYFVILEMIGFFSSKIIDDSRENPLVNSKDFLPEKYDYKEISEKLKRVFEIPLWARRKLYYEQGYSMGDKMYNLYISGLISKEEIKKIFTNPLEEEYEAFYQFLNWKYEILNHKNKIA